MSVTIYREKHTNLFGRGETIYIPDRIFTFPYIWTVHEFWATGRLLFGACVDECECGETQFIITSKETQHIYYIYNKCPCIEEHSYKAGISDWTPIFIG